MHENDLSRFLKIRFNSICVTLYKKDNKQSINTFIHDVQSDMYAAFAIPNANRITTKIFVL